MEVILLVEVVVVAKVIKLSVHIRPDESVNIPSLSAFEVNHAPHSVCAKDEAPLNINFMLVTLDTSHFERSALKDVATENMERMSATLDTSHFERSELNEDAA